MKATETGSERRNEWKDAIDDGLVCAHIGTADSFPNARAALNALLVWQDGVSRYMATHDGSSLPASDALPEPVRAFLLDLAECDPHDLDGDLCRSRAAELLDAPPPPAPAPEDEPPPAWVVALIRNTFADAQAGKVFGTENALSDDSVETMRAFLERWDRPAVQP